MRRKPLCFLLECLSHWVFSPTRPEGDWGRAESPQCARRRKPPAPGGLDAPTPAREKGLQPYGALTLFFRWRKKSVQKKASGTATPGKRLLLPILTAGLAMSRAAELASLRMLSCALGARLFPPPKWAGLFPSAAYRRSAPPQSAWVRLIPCGVNGFLMVGWLCRDKGQQVFEKMLAFVASHEARRRMAV